MASGGAGKREPLSAVLDRNSLTALRRVADSVYIDRKITEYIVSIVTATRPVPAGNNPSGAIHHRTQAAAKTAEGVYRYVSFGASPRASIALHNCSRILALFSGREFVSPEDVKAAAYPALRHRIVLSYEAEADGLDADAVISRILSHVPVP
jgi:MoxR-like ATPase